MAKFFKKFKSLFWQHFLVLIAKTMGYHDYRNPFSQSFCVNFRYMTLFADPKTTYCKSEYVLLSLDMICPTCHIPFFCFIDFSLYAKSRTEITNTAEDIIIYKEPINLTGEELFGLKLENQFFHGYTVLTGW